MSEVNKIDQIKSVLSKLDNKDFNIYFFTLDTKGNPTAGIANIYEHVKVLNELGFKTHILHEKSDYKLNSDEDGTGLTEWLGEEYGELPHVSIDSKNLSIKPEDFIIIPEVFSNIMDQVKKFPCKKIVLSQSYEYILELLPIGRRWTDYDFNDVITTSKKQADYIETLFPSIQTHVIPVSIPEFFKASEKPKVPVVTILTRTSGEAAKIAKKFYLQHPMYKWITFKELRGLSRSNFARELSTSCLAVWVDDISGFGTFPLEAIESDTLVIGKMPNMLPEWMVNTDENGEDGIRNNGIWTNTVNNIPDLIASFLKFWLEDNVPTEILEDMGKTKGVYSVSKQREAIEQVFSTLITNRKEELNNIIKIINEDQEDKK